MTLPEGVREGVKISERALACEHPMVQRRIKSVRAMEYELLVHETDTLDSTRPMFTLLLTMHDGNKAYIQSSLASVFSQTYANTEVILINNGAQGEVGETIWQAFLRHPNAKLIRLAKNWFNPAASDLDYCFPNLWNAGLFCSKGNVVYFLSYDDYVSQDYAEKMVALFEGNENCTTASPLVVSINEEGEVNAAKSEELRQRNRRGRYTQGTALVRSYMQATDLISAPGGLLATKSDVVLACGGFDKMSDVSQMFRFAVTGESGFDPEARLYWRHHAGQTNKVGLKMGLVYYASYAALKRLYRLHELHDRFGGPDFAAECDRWIDRRAEQETIVSFIGASEYGFRSGMTAFCRILVQCPPRITVKALFALGSENFWRLYYGHIPQPIQKSVREVKRAVYAWRSSKRTPRSTV